jgi:nickel-dependent lactate racemase
VGVDPAALCEPVRGWSNALICVPDATRSVDTPAALRALAKVLGPGAKVLVGLGLHRTLTSGELNLLTVAWPGPLLQHTPDRCVYQGMVQGLPFHVHPAVLQADHIIAVGAVELHQYAGFSGGHKAVVVGCGGRATLGALHAREMVCDPKVQVGKLLDNPFRDAIDAMGEVLGRSNFALQQLPDRHWVSGPTQSAFEHAARLLSPWRRVDKRYARVIVDVPPSKASNFYQASRAATYLALSPSPPLLPGAEIILNAACPEGMGQGSGERAFAKLMRQTPFPWQALLDGPVPQGAGIQRAFMLARLAEHYRLSVMGCQRPELLTAHGISASPYPPEVTVDTLHVRQPFVQLPQWEPGAGS